MLCTHGRTFSFLPHALLTISRKKRETESKERGKEWRRLSMSLFFSAVPFLFSLFLAVFPGIETKVRRKKRLGKGGKGKRGEIDLCVCLHERNAHDAAIDEWSTWHFLPPSATVPKLRSIINRSNREKCGPKHAAQFGENMARIPTFETQFFSSPFFP